PGDKVSVSVGATEVFNISTDGTNTSISLTPMGTGTVNISGAVLNGSQSFTDLILSGTLAVGGHSTLTGGATLGADLNMGTNSLTAVHDITGVGRWENRGVGSE